MKKACSMSFRGLMNYNSPSFLPIRLLSLSVSLWGVVSSSRALNLTSPPPPFFTWPSPFLFFFSPCLCLFFYSQELGSDIRCHSVPFPHYWADYQHAFTPAETEREKNWPESHNQNLHQYHQQPGRWKPQSASHSLSPPLSLGQNNNEPMGLHLNSSRRRIMTWTF